MTFTIDGKTGKTEKTIENNSLVMNDYVENDFVASSQMESLWEWNGKTTMPGKIDFNPPSEGYILDLVVFYDNTMLNQFSKKEAERR